MEHSQEYLADIKKYDELLKNKNLPVIYSLKHLCLLADVNFDSIVALCNSNRIDRYKRFKLKKKKGGYRIIQSPIGELKYLQRWILCNILENIPSHLSCKGFEKGTSIIENAKIHLNSDSLLKIDLMRFYDSINEKRIFGIFKSLGYQSNLCVSLAKICTIVPNDMFLNSFRKRENNLKKYIQSKKDEGILAQGSPTSPKLSNLVLKNLDKRLLSLAKKHNLNYSRYADDLTFSGEIEELQLVKKIVYRIIREENLFVNYGKTKYAKKGGVFLVTGLNVQNEIVKIPQKKKKEIEHHLFHCKKNGVENHLIESKIKNRNFKDWLFGNIAFVYSVEKELGQKYFIAFDEIQWPI